MFVELTLVLGLQIQAIDELVLVSDVANLAEQMNRRNPVRLVKFYFLNISCLSPQK